MLLVYLIKVNVIPGVSTWGGMLGVDRQLKKPSYLLELRGAVTYRR